MKVPWTIGRPECSGVRAVTWLWARYHAVPCTRGRPERAMRTRPSAAGAENRPERREAEASLDGRVRRPFARPWPHRQRAAGLGEERQEADGGDRGPCQRQSARRRQPADQLTGAEPCRQHERHPCAVGDAVRRKPADPQRLGDERVGGDHEGDDPRQAGDEGRGPWKRGGPLAEARRRGRRGR